MTTRDKVAHLLRRFGLGATQAELDRLEPLGVKGAADFLLEFEQTPDAYRTSPWEFALREDENINLDPQRFSAWWGLRLLMTNRPAQEKLTLFWHDHFAISASKVENGPLMLQNNETIRTHAAGNFRTLLGEMTKDPAMLRWLDGDVSIKGKPNENYAREVLELFTLGIGHYTETDIQELARAFTGWGLRAGYRNPGRGGSQKRALMDTLSLGLPFVASAYCEGLHDASPKTILGKTADFDTDSALDWIVSQPQTARHITGKLWAFYAYPNPEPKIVDRLAKTFVTSRYEIKPVLRAIADSPEFWSDKCVRQQVKSPVDFTIALLRQMEIGLRVGAVRSADAAAPDQMMMAGAQAQGSMNLDAMKPIPAAVAGVAGLIINQLQRQGMRLFYPPDVAGWDWGEAWVSPAMMAERMRFANLMVQRGRQSGVSEALRQMLVRGGTPQSSEELVLRFARVFDVEIPANRKGTLVEAADKAGGADALQEPLKAALLLQSLSRLTFGMPEFQLA